MDADIKRYDALADDDYDVHRGNFRCYKGPPPFPEATVAECTAEGKWENAGRTCLDGCMEEKLPDYEGKPVYRAACMQYDHKNAGERFGPFVSSEDRRLLVRSTNENVVPAGDDYVESADIMAIN